MIANWRTNLGGALGALGSALVGFGVVPQLAGTPSKWLTYMAAAGFIISAIGKFFTALFAADATVVKNLSTQVQANTNDIATATGNTSQIIKPPTP